MERNPYAPPEAAVSDAPIGGMGIEEEPASRGRRFGNFLIDMVCYYLLAMLVGIVLGLMHMAYLLRMSVAGNYLFGGVVIVLYYLPMEVLFGRTVGKLVTGTRVVAESGEPADFLKVLGRTLTRLVPFEAFTFLNSKGIGLHDRWSGTRVVRTRRSHTE